MMGQTTVEHLNEGAELKKTKSCEASASSRGT